jgi:hypothetical protein
MNAPTQIPVSSAQIIFCSTDETAHSAIDRMIADADGWLVAIDLETAPDPSEIERLARLRRQHAEARGKNSRPRRSSRTQPAC